MIFFAYFSRPHWNRCYVLFGLDCQSLPHDNDNAGGARGTVRPWLGDPA